MTASQPAYIMISVSTSLLGSLAAVTRKFTLPPQLYFILGLPQTSRASVFVSLIKRVRQAGSLPSVKLPVKE